MTSIEISKIRTDGGTQPRASLSADTVAEYRRDMDAGATGANQGGNSTLKPEERTGSTGSRRPGRRVRRKWSDRKIAEVCGVTHPFVGKVRAERSGGGNGYHDREVAPFPQPAHWTLPGAAELLAHPWVAWRDPDNAWSDCATVWPSQAHPGFVYISVLQGSSRVDEGGTTVTTRKPVRADIAWLNLDRTGFPSDARWHGTTIVPFGHWPIGDNPWDRPWNEDRERSAAARAA